MKTIIKYFILSFVVLFGLILYILMFQVNGWRAFTVLSSSMEPAINTGSLVFIKKIPAEKLREGDIITFNAPRSNNITVTHRIVIKELENNAIKIKTKGDKNKTADSWTIYDSAILGKVEYVIPYIGYGFSFLNSKIGILLFIVLPSMWILLDEIHYLIKLIKENILIKNKLNSVLLLLIGFSILLSNLNPPNTYALVSDSAILNETTYIVTANPNPELRIHFSENKKYLSFLLTNISGYDFFEYNLTYKHNMPVIGERLTGNEHITGKEKFEKAILLGTCSDKSCVYHKRIMDIELEVTLINKSGNKVTLKGFIENQIDPDEFPSCLAPTGKVIASYSKGKHEIIGVGLLSGSDYVYQLNEHNKDRVMQCYCSENGRGIQTNWIRTDDIEGYKTKGWPYSIKSGSSWNLDAGSYAAQNVEYKCSIKY